jgi:adenosine deaminase
MGVDVAAGENHFASDSSFHNAHLGMCQKAVQLGIPVTLHAGETPDSERNVEVAIRDYGARRIGHGYRMSTQDDIIELAKSKNIHFENYLTSSVVSPVVNEICMYQRIDKSK